MYAFVDELLPRISAHFAHHQRHKFAGRGAFFGTGWSGPRARRGDLKFAILEILQERPRHGYDVMLALAERRGAGASPGSVYPTLQMLEDGGYVTSEPSGGKRVFTITQAGRELRAQRRPSAEEPEAEYAPRAELREAAMKLAGAVMGGAARSADPKVHARVREVLDRARREIYQILAEEA